MPPDQASTESPGWETIEELFAALESPLLSYAVRLAGDPGVAEDIVQEAFMRLHTQFDEVREPRRWLYRTVHNLALNQRRQAGKIVSLTQPGDGGPLAANDTADPQPLPDEQIARWEGIGLVRLSLEGLDERSRELVRLKFNEDLSYKEIADIADTPIGTVMSRLARARQKLHAELLALARKDPTHGL